MSDDVTNWDAVARAKLTHILGAQKCEQTLAKALSTVGLVSIRSAHDLKRVADALKPEGGLIGVTGALLSLHATIHGSKSSQD